MTSSPNQSAVVHRIASVKGGDTTPRRTGEGRSTSQRIGDRFGRWSEDYPHRCSKAIVAEAKRHGCTHIAFEDLEQIRERISDGQKFQQWAFRKLQEQVAYEADEHGIIRQLAAGSLQKEWELN